MNFALPRHLEAAAPPAQRDGVRLLVARRGRHTHAPFRALPRFLRPGDLLVVNASATIPAALDARREHGAPVTLHLSTPEPRARVGAGVAPEPLARVGVGAPATAAAPLRWIVELRRDGTRVRDGRAGERLSLPGGAAATLLAPYLSPGRLWIAALDVPGELLGYLARHGRPIAYRHLAAPRPLADHQTIFATEPGSAEMPSAGRPFTPRVLEHLRARGVQIATIVLHTGVSSLERGERPYPERYRVPAATAGQVNRRRGRLIAVGTTVVRALESAADERGAVHPGEGWTTLTVTPERGVRAVDGLLTGWHEPETSHLLMLEAVAGSQLIERSYAAALAHGYRWHEFGDVHLILP